VIAALGLALSQGLNVFLGLVAMTALGLLYSVRIFPESWLRVVRIEKLKDIPASKTVFVAAGWSVVATILPGLRSGWDLGSPTLFAVLVVFLLVFVRSALFDMLDIQGDRLVGEETIPIVIGERRTMRFLVGSVFGLAVLLALAPSLGIASGFSYLLLIACGYLGFYLFAHQRQLIRSGSLRFEILVESSFYLCGGLAVLYQIVTR
jgi:4-hydroxy-3-methylbut-2-enyl diphosphate reductase